MKISKALCLSATVIGLACTLFLTAWGKSFNNSAFSGWIAVW
jgi:hypothetical protein